MTGRVDGHFPASVDLGTIESGHDNKSAPHGAATPSGASPTEIGHDRLMETVPPRADIAPDDPRHGTTAGYQAHRKTGLPACPPCVAAKTRYEKARDLYGNRMVPSIGTRRRIRALMALGHSGAEIGGKLGVTYQAVHKLEHGESPVVLAVTAVNVRRVYDSMSMTLPSGPHADRIRSKASRLGYAPPLAWDDVDNPDETPAGRYEPAARADLIREYIDRGDNLTMACRAMGLAVNTLNSWCCHNDMRAEYRTLASREGDWNSSGRIAHGGAA